MMPKGKWTIISSMLCHFVTGSLWDFCANSRIHWHNATGSFIAKIYGIQIYMGPWYLSLLSAGHQVSPNRYLICSAMSAQRSRVKLCDRYGDRVTNRLTHANTTGSSVAISRISSIWCSLERHHHTSAMPSFQPPYLSVCSRLNSWGSNSTMTRSPRWNRSLPGNSVFGLLLWDACSWANRRCISTDTTVQTTVNTQWTTNLLKQVAKVIRQRLHRILLPLLWRIGTPIQPRVGSGA